MKRRCENDTPVWQTRNQMGCCLALLLILVSWRQVTSADLPATNPPVRWLSLAEVRQKWANVPLAALQTAADGGDLTAEHYLGYCYAEGFRFEQNPALGISYYERAAKAGYLPSWNNLGLLYQRGKIVKQDYARAIQDYRWAADSGMAQAQANLGFMYRDGVGVKRDPQEAMKWFLLAAAQGHGGATVEIGRLYRFGNGVQKDLGAAETWFAKAAEKGNAVAELKLALLYDQDEGMPDKAISFYKQAADDGDTDAMASLYLVYSNGRGVAVDRAEGVKWLTKAAEAGSAHAQCLLGDYHENPRWETAGGRMVLPPPNMPEAVRWYRLSADQGWAGGQYHLGLCYLAGNGVEQNEEHGLELLRQAADQNHAYAEFDLAGLYARGIGEPRNDQDRPDVLLQRVLKSDQQDDYYEIKNAYDSLVFRQEHGIGSEPDIFAAVQWYCRGAVAGMDGYSIADKIEPGPKVDPNIKSFHGDAGRKSLAISWPAISGRFRSAMSEYLKAAVSSDHSGLMLIGEKYLTGRGVPKSASKAWLWFSLASENGVSDAAPKILEAETHMTAAGLTEARQQLPDKVKDLSSAAFLLRSTPQTNFNTHQ
jgi:TPR repeat protein